MVYPFDLSRRSTRRKAREEVCGCQPAFRCCQRVGDPAIATCTAEDHRHTFDQETRPQAVRFGEAAWTRPGGTGTHGRFGAASCKSACRQQGRIADASRWRPRGRHTCEPPSRIASLDAAARVLVAGTTGQTRAGLRACAAEQGRSRPQGSRRPRPTA